MQKDVDVICGPPTSRALRILLVTVAVGVLTAPAALAGWRVQRAPAPDTFRQDWLTGVSCASRSFCIAVGRSTNSGAGSVTQTLAERWNGHRWLIQQTPTLPGPAPDSGNRTLSELEAVSCTSSEFCMAVGGNVAGDRPESGLSELWNGHSWSVEPVPQTASMQSPLTSVSCTSPASCIGLSGSLTERWNGASWSVVSSSFLGSSASISCVSAVLCIGAAVDFSAAGDDLATTMRWRPSGWRRMRTPHPWPSYNDSDFYSVACSSATSCTAVGDREIGGNVVYVPLAEHWNGSRWSVQATPRYHGSWDNELEGVSCPTRGMCAAVGFALFDTRPDRPVLGVWSRGSWVSEPSPTLPRAQDRDLNAVSCISREICTAVGTWDTFRHGSLHTHPLVERTTDALATRRPPVKRRPPFTG